jgi:hypothetical protein
VIRRRAAILQGAAVAAVLSGAPSTTWAVAHGSPRSAIDGGLEATRAIGTLVWPGTPGLVRGALAHGAISLAVGGGLGVTLPRERSVVWGASGSAAIGWVNLAVIARRRYPAIAALPLAPQLADNAAFGAIFAIVSDRYGGGGTKSGAPSAPLSLRAASPTI